MSAIGLYYYLIILKQALIVKSTEAVSPIKVPLPASIALLVSLIALLGLGIFPSLVLGLF